MTHHHILLTVYRVTQTLFTTSVQQKGFYDNTLTPIQNLIKQQRSLNILICKFFHHSVFYLQFMQVKLSF